MDYIDLGTIGNIKKYNHKKNIKSRKSVSDFSDKTAYAPKNKLSHLKIITVSALLIGVFLFATYAFLPHVKIFWNDFFKGPSIVMSFLKSDPKELKQDDDTTNVLLVGIDKRSSEPYSYKGTNGEEEKNGFLADTIVIASYSHLDHSIVMLSIPRDLWVEIPAFNDLYKQSTKINAAYSIGDMYDYDGGGLALTKKVVSNILGIPIHYAARVDFQGFVKGVDVLGGIDIDVENTFDDYMYPREGYENAPMTERFIHLHFDAGLQHMDGETALRYARSRQGTNGEGSDFARAKRQQKVILAAREKATSLNFIDSLSKVSGLLDTFGESVESDIDISEMMLFYKLAQDFDPENVQTHVLDNGDSESSLLYHPPLEQFGGGWVLVPKGNNFDIVQEFVKKVFYIERTFVEVPSQETETTPSSN
ncbi:hypothetical protein A2X44_05550 [candidate division CPR3 bacterium GWF2_35_18]|uniref:Cell envelope-related transcriptional attenuator n=1 Tax=candidate division CPR3 bacterium GW2011_GWF2_35_18 TaxID=1618350 RepID=A0A0G0BYH2_UNCC3|nr:MAG: Cell envelope-related transcriptional attenuator [candidate division CPR3 bacterium GW2011_GWF2_35_18]KKP86561.1 MAG: Cell envelope-related transcriptional attenuator [candidate division CPR3 bacterium GW2011_GWE2_35_7]OGB63216.1 MAG: hypothetical protein A2X44_05550 [candidate division CPR3 bacterium GWF2_35_18]OGB64130.1 MAG: hypothetical protein A2250_03710 [candidate division CPR3 bacterium RIFOXYA2_FULL_35_13]OGB79317.1 MAG: hypothetical protein A2296_02365 [candidate division CPR3